MPSSRLKRPALALACAVACAPLMAATPVAAPEIVGYYPGWKSDAFAVTAANVGAGKLTMVLYAFVDVCWDGKHGNADPTVNDVAPCQDAAGEAASANGALVLRDAASDGANLRRFSATRASRWWCRWAAGTGRTGFPTWPTHRPRAPPSSPRR